MPGRPAFTPQQAQEIKRLYVEERWTSTEIAKMMSLFKSKAA